MNLKVFLIIISSGFIFTDKGFGQSKFSISGKVYSKINQKSLSNAIIRINGKETYGVGTDSTGYFRITKLLTGKYDLKIFDFGYNRIDTTFFVEDESISDVEIWLNADCDFNKETAMKDIREEKVKLLLIESIAPVIYTTDEKFEKKYKVAYYDFGCTPPAHECVIQYNETIFKYLDEKYNGKWRKHVRKDVIGL